ncbi:MAG: hypothetical protein EAZ85_16065, partial [Bacteroidetes bacterium]
MDLKDLALTPIYYLLIYIVLNNIKNNMKDEILKQYFIPAFNVKVVGGIAFGMVYYFYYGGGDTVNFYNDTLPIFEAFLDNPVLAFQIITIKVGEYPPELYSYLIRIFYYVEGDKDTFNVIRISAVLSIFTFNTYSCITLGFALLSFTGMWKMYRVFYDLYPHLHRPLAWSIFFIPSVYFWGSGLMKDSICIGALGWMMYGFYFGFVKREKIILHIFYVLFAAYLLYNFKRYILFAGSAPMILWGFLQYRTQIKNKLLRDISLPFLLAVGIPFGFFVLTKISEGDSKYSLENLGNTAKISSEWLHTVGTQQKGSAYSLGKLDGTLASTITLAPQAIWLGLFQPHPWQARNIVMIISSLETTFLLILTIKILLNSGFLAIYRLFLAHPVTLFCLALAVLMAFGAAIASANYGSLVRYRIPMLPFYLA